MSAWSLGVRLLPLLGAAVACCAPRHAPAQDAVVLARISACAREPVSTIRLHCYDRLARELEDMRTRQTLAPAPTQSDPVAPQLYVARDPEGRIRDIGGWTVFRDQDRMTGATRTTLELSGSVESGAGRTNPSLGLRCAAGQLTAFFQVGVALGNRPTTTVRLRFDETPLVTQTWRVSTSGTLAFAQEPRAFAEQLAAAQAVLLEASEARGGPMRARFVTAGIDRIVEELAPCRQAPPPHETAPRRR
jgi:hypothetical protein